MFDGIDRIEGNDFQEFCSVLLHAELKSFQAVDGSGGDGGNDGFLLAGDILFQAYGPRLRDRSKFKKKIDESIRKAKGLRQSQFPGLRQLVFLTNFDCTADQHDALRLAGRASGFEVKSWGMSKLAEMLARHPDLRQLFPRLLLPDLATTLQRIEASLARAREGEEIRRNDELEVDFFPDLHVLQSSCDTAQPTERAHAQFRIRIFSPEFAVPDFEPDEEQVFLDLVREMFPEHLACRLEPTRGDCVAVEQRGLDLQYHARWGWWTSGVVGMAGTLAGVPEPTQYSVVDLLLDVLRAIELALQVGHAGAARLVFELDVDRLTPIFHSFDRRMAARNGMALTIAGVQDRGQVCDERATSCKLSCTLDLEELTQAPEVTAGKLVIRGLRWLHKARIDTTLFVQSIPQLRERYERALRS